MIVAWLWASALGLYALPTYAPFTIGFVFVSLLFLITQRARTSSELGKLVIPAVPAAYVIVLSLIRLEDIPGVVLAITVCAGFLALLVGKVAASRTSPRLLLLNVSLALGVALTAGIAGTLSGLPGLNALFLSRYTAGYFAILGVFIILDSRTDWLGLRITVGVIAATATAFAGARTVSVILMIALVLFLFRALRPHTAIPVISASAVVGTGAYLLAGDRILARFKSGWEGDTLSLGPLEVYSSGRAAIWEAVWRDSIGAPLFGHGGGHSVTVVDTVNENIGHPLNEYLRVFDDMGLVGLAALGYFILVLVRALHRVGPDARGGLAVLLACLALAVTDNTLMYSLWLVPAGLLIGYSLYRRHSPEGTESGLSGTLQARETHRQNVPD